MNLPLLRNTKIILSLLFFAGIFQNCSSLVSERQRSQSETRDHLVTGVKCPIYLEPNCSESSQLRLIENEHGCRYNICAHERRLSLCPKQSAPLCKAYQETRELRDQNSCLFKKCVFKGDTQQSKKRDAFESTPIDSTCPQLDESISCGSGSVRALRVDQSLCLSFACKKKVNFNCPRLKDLSCQKNETSFSVFDQTGCAKIVCKNTAQIRCPERINSKCKKDEFVKVIQDKGGCKQNLCIQKPKVKKQSCSLSKPPRCLPGSNLRVAVLPNGCTKPYCL